MREWICSLETVHPSNISKHTSMWLRDLPMYGMIQEEWPPVTVKDDKLALKKKDGRIRPSLEHSWKIFTDIKKARTSE
jgi:hypothetical protein